MHDKEKCYISGQSGYLEEHHVFGGNPNRKNSEKYGLKVYLKPKWHNESPTGVHHDSELMDRLHKDGQRAFERVHGTREQFMDIFGRNYLEDEYNDWEYPKGLWDTDE